MTHGNRQWLNRAIHPALILAAHLAGPPATLAAQTVVESETPGMPDLTLADEPQVRVGMLDGPTEYLFSTIEGGVRLEDGSIVLADEQTYEIRMFDARGRHVWTSGRQGEGPGEYGGVRLLRGCPGTAITVFDWSLDRITRLNRDGNVIDTRALAGTGVQPYGSPACSPTGDLVFVGWPGSELDSRPAGVGEIYRWEMAVSWEGDDGVVTLAEGIPGTERRTYGGGSGPLTWGKSERWPGIRDDLPERFPAYESDGLLALPDGSVWVTTHMWRAPRKELHLLDPNGMWVRRLTIPARSNLLDAGLDWVLLLERGEFDEQSVAVYELVERGDAG